MKRTIGSLRQGRPTPTLELARRLPVPRLMAIPPFLPQPATGLALGGRPPSARRRELPRQIEGVPLAGLWQPGCGTLWISGVPPTSLC